MTLKNDNCPGKVINAKVQPQVHTENVFWANKSLRILWRSRSAQDATHSIKISFRSEINNRIFKYIRGVSCKETTNLVFLPFLCVKVWAVLANVDIFKAVATTSPLQLLGIWNARVRSEEQRTGRPFLRRRRAEKKWICVTKQNCIALKRWGR